MSDYPFKTTTYHVDSAGSLAMSGRGTFRSIGIETADGMIEFELTAVVACAVREFLADAVCAECAPKDHR